MPDEDPASDSAAFAAHVLRAALEAPGVDTPVAGATVLSLLRLLLAEGALGRVAWVLDTAPGSTSTFEVRSYSFGGVEPEQRVTGLNAEGALRRVLGQAEAGVDMVEAVALDASGLARRVIESRRGGQARYLVPAEGSYEGDPDAIEQALRRWRSAPQPSGAEAGASEVARRDGADPPPAAGPFEPPPEVVDLLRRTVRQALEEVTVEVDLGAIEAVVTAAVGQLVGDGATLLPPGPGLDPAQLDRLVAALERPPAPLDPALAGRILAALEERPGPDLALPPGPGPAALPPAPPRPAPAGGAGDPGDAAAVHLAAAAERLSALSEMFEDRIRSSTRALEALADDVAAGVRGSEDHVGRLTHSVTAIVERLGRRLESRLDAPPSGAAPDLAALAERLEAAVAALDAERLHT